MNDEKVLYPVAMKVTDRRQFAGTLMAGAATLLSAKSYAASARPNIVYLLLDDAGYGDLSCYGQKRFETPNIDRVAAEGVKFTDHYAGCAVCAPSRCCLMTGLHTGHTYIRGNKSAGLEGELPLPEGTVTLPKLLQDAGYATGAFGKWGLGGPNTSGDPVNQGFDEFFGYTSQMQAHNYYPDHLWHNGQKVMLNHKVYSQDLIWNRSLDFVRANKENPFFLYLPVTIPHASMQVPIESARPYRKKFRRYQLSFGFYSGRPVRNPAAAFAGMMTRLDSQVGDLMALLGQLGLDDNTIVMITSDNGPHKEGGHVPDFFDSNGPFRGYKRDLYEGGIRVPMIARWPGKIQPGSMTSLPSAFWDVMPTLCDLSGAKAPAGIDGVSFAPTLLGANDQRQHDYLYWEFHEQGGKQAARSGDYKAVKNGVTLNPDAKLELYNLADDPGEARDLAADKPGLATQMDEIIHQARTESDEFKLFLK